MFSELIIEMATITALSSVSLNLLVLFARSARVRANPEQAPEFVKSNILTDCNAFTTSVFIGVISLTLSLAGLTTSYT